MFTLNTFAVGVETTSGLFLIARCHNRVTAEFLLRKVAGSNTQNTVVLAPGASFDRDVSHEPAITAWVSA